MGFLETLGSDEIVGGMYWCYRVEGGKPSERIQKLISKHRGRLVPIVGFDEFMIQLNTRFGYPFLAEEMESKSKSRINTYTREF